MHNAVSIDSFVVYFYLLCITSSISIPSFSAVYNRPQGILTYSYIAWIMLFFS